MPISSLVVPVAPYLLRYRAESVWPYGDAYFGVVALHSQDA